MLLPSKARRMRDALADWNHKEIVFYGVLTDQFGNPVTGATVTGKVSVNNGLREGVDTISGTSGSDGRFTLGGTKGESLVISVVKPGYVMSTDQVTFIYSYIWAPSERHVPDVSHPVDVRMWKLQGAEALAKIDWHFKLPHTNQPIRIDLLEGQVVSAGGDLIITVERPEGEISSRTFQSWGAGLQAVDGGLIDGGRAYRVTFAAPADGYGKSLAWKFATNSPSNWTTFLSQGVFLKSRNNRLQAKVALGIGINMYPEEKMTIDIRGNINTNGSGNWEATIER